MLIIYIYIVRSIVTYTYVKVRDHRPILQSIGIFKHLHIIIDVVHVLFFPEILSTTPLSQPLRIILAIENSNADPRRKRVLLLQDRFDFMALSSAFFSFPPAIAK